ncbi:hypothetical protein CHS0354_025868 [Potamilus streckersoni]|uniref:Uncharacterized protein n=1 Tax=Potamilus streckersoni TaxID=2493646 RepID=A0AAE0VTX7_9BIVA|nr:hypothetical protein CHS0354_025868 [Potamilus streckersoni]
MSQAQKDVKLLEELHSSCCNKLLCKAVTLSCGHTLCDRCFWETARKATIRDCISVKCKKCGETKDTTVIEFPHESQLVGLQCDDKCQYFTACEIHTFKFQIYFCSDHGEALCTDCVSEHKSQSCYIEPIENKIKELKKYSEDIFSDQRFKSFVECLCSVDNTEILLDLFYFKMKRKIHGCKERLAQELGISIQDQELIKHVHDDVQRADQMVESNIFTHNTLDELLRNKNSCGSIMSNLKWSEHAEAWPAFVANKSKDFEYVLEYNGDPVRLSLVDWSVYQSSSCVEDEEAHPCEPSDSNALQSAVLEETDDYDSDGFTEYDNSFDASDDCNDEDYDVEEEVKEDIEDVQDVPANINQHSLTRGHDVSLPNQTIAEQHVLQPNRPPRKDGGLLKSTDYRRKLDHPLEPYSSRPFTNKSIPIRDSDTIASISRYTDDRRKDVTSFVKVKTTSDILPTTCRDIVTNYRQSTSEPNDAATFTSQAHSFSSSETNTERTTTSDSRRNKNTPSSTDSLLSSVKCKPQKEIKSATDTINGLKLTSFSESSITTVNANSHIQTGTQSPSDHNTAPTTERYQQNPAREPTYPINIAPGMETRYQLPQIKEDFTVGQCVGIVISDRFILTSYGKRLQKRRFEDSKLIEDTELSNMTSLCLVPSSGEISVLQTNKSIRVYSAAVSKWHFRTEITLPYQSICCWKVDQLDTWKTYVFVVSYTNDIRQDCIKMITISHYCSFPKSDKECECTTPRDSVLLTSETSPSIRGVNSLAVMRCDQQLLISAMEGLVCAKVSGGESAEIMWICRFRTNISQIACDDMHVYVCVPNEERVAKVSKSGDIIIANILPAKIVADRIAVKENTVLVGSFFHGDWTCKVYRITF